MNPNEIFSPAEQVIAGEYDIPGFDVGTGTILDIGANTGGFVRWASHRWPGAKIVAYEPHPENFERLHHNVGRASGVTLERAAVTQQENALLKVGLCAFTHSLYDIGGQNGHTMEVPLVHPDKLPDADFIKIDAEGAEREILEGYYKSHKHLPNGIAIEWHRDEDRDWAVDFFSSQGYKVECHRSNKDLGILTARKDSIRVENVVSLHLGVCNYGYNINDLYVRSREACEREGLFHSISNVSDSLITRSRNTIARRFLDSGDTHLLFIDTDIVFLSQHIRSMLNAMQSGIDVVGGMYALKQPKLQWCMNELPGEKPDATGLLRVKYVGTGFMAISRRVFEKMAVAFPESAYLTDDNELLTQMNGAKRCINDFFPSGVYRPPGVSSNSPGRLLSEDWYFCQRCEDIGIPVYAHTGVKVKHIGMIAYPLMQE